MNLINNLKSYFGFVKENNFDSRNKSITEILEFIDNNKLEIIGNYGFKIYNEIDEKNLNKNCGLENIGNTCYMNSALQCFISIKPLKKYFLSNEFINDLNIINPISTKGQLACEYNKLISKIYNDNYKYLNPKELKNVITKISKQFKGNYQHDSQEFLSYFITTLHEDTNKILKKPYIEIPNFKENENLIEYSNICWEIFKKRNQSKIIDFIYGQFKTTINCQNCNYISYNFDEFNQISVPIIDVLQFTFYYYSLNENKNYKYTQNLRREITFGSFLEEFFKLKNLNLNEHKFYFMSNFKIIEEIKDLDLYLEEIENSRYYLFIMKITENYKNSDKIINFSFELENNEFIIERELLLNENLKNFELYNFIYSFLKYKGELEEENLNNFLLVNDKPFII